MLQLSGPVVLPFPSWPRLFFPQHFTPPEEVIVAYEVVCDATSVHQLKPRGEKGEKNTAEVQEDKRKR